MARRVIFGEITSAPHNQNYQELYEGLVEAESVVKQGNQMINLAQIATDSANRAANRANEAASKANLAADNANQAADRANQAADNAEAKIVDVETRFQTLTAQQQQSSEVIDARKGFPSLKGKIDDIDNQLNGLKQSQTATTTIEGGIGSLPSNVVKGQISVTLKGNTYTNLLGEYGNCESLTGWTGATFELTNDCVIGSKAIKATRKAGERHLQARLIGFPITLRAGKSYLISGYLKNIDIDSTVELQLRYKDDLGTVVAFKSFPSTKNIWMRTGVVFSPTSDDVVVVQMSALYATGTTFIFDGIMITEIPDSEKNLDIVLLLQKYPYIDGTKSTLSARVKSVGKNLFNHNDKITQGTTYVSYQRTADYIEVSNTSGSFQFIKTAWIMVEPNTNYTLSFEGVNVSGADAPRIRVTAEDDVANLGIRTGSGSITFNTGANKKIRLYLYASTDTNAAQTKRYSKIQIEKGTTATAYEPYKETVVYIPADVVLRSLPNGVKDEFNIVEGKHTKRVSDPVSVSGTMFASLDTTTYVNVDVVKTTAFSDAMAGTTSKDGMTRLYDKNGAELSEVAQTDIDNAASVGKYYWHTDKTLWIIVAKGAYANITAARTGLGTMTLNYQLASPIVFNYRPQVLTGYPNGTIYWEPVVAPIETIYNNGIVIPDINLPIKQLDQVKKRVGDSYVNIDLSKCVVAGNGLSFTINGAQNGEVYIYSYYYDQSLSTIPTLEITYPVNIAASLEQINELQARLSQEIGNVWLTLLPLADKELRMYMITTISAPATATVEQVANKINEIINAWKS